MYLNQTQDGVETNVANFFNIIYDDSFLLQLFLSFEECIKFVQHEREEGCRNNSWVGVILFSMSRSTCAGTFSAGGIQENTVLELATEILGVVHHRTTLFRQQITGIA